MKNLDEKIQMKKKKKKKKNLRIRSGRVVYLIAATIDKEKNPLRMTTADSYRQRADEG